MITIKINSSDKINVINQYSESYSGSIYPRKSASTSAHNRWSWVECDVQPIRCHPFIFPGYPLSRWRICVGWHRVHALRDRPAARFHRPRIRAVTGCMRSCRESLLVSKKQLPGATGAESSEFADLAGAPTFFSVTTFLNRLLSSQAGSSHSIQLASSIKNHN
jgi:hypothetical protein